MGVGLANYTHINRHTFDAPVYPKMMAISNIVHRLSKNYTLPNRNCVDGELLNKLSVNNWNTP